MSVAKSIIHRISQSIQQSAIWVLEAAKRIFSPSDDNYPATGLQPFKGHVPEMSQR